MVSFDLDEETPFMLTGLLSLELQGCDASTDGRIRLSGPGGVIAEVSRRFSGYPDADACAENCQASLPVSASGVMPPGSYTLEVRVDGDSYEAVYPGDPCDGAIATGSYSASLVLTPPQVPALPGASGALLAAALALAARRARPGVAARKRTHPSGRRGLPASLGVLRVALIASVPVCISVSAGALTPVAQDRHVFARHDLYTLSGEFHDSETASAPDYGPFSASVDGFTLPIEYSPIAVQSSSIEPERLQASGNTVANAPQQAEEIYEMRSESIFSVDFTIDEQRAFTLTGQLDLFVQDFEISDSGCATATGGIALLGPGGVVAEVAGSEPDQPWPCSEGCRASLPLAASGVLAPGTYTLEARSETFSEGTFLPHLKCSNRSTGSYSADLALVPPVPALPPGSGAALAAALALAARRSRR